jgi:hypothetical protein
VLSVLVLSVLVLSVLVLSVSEGAISWRSATACGSSATVGADDFVDQISTADSNALAPIQVEAALSGTEFFLIQPSRETDSIIHTRISQSHND